MMQRDSFEHGQRYFDHYCKTLKIRFFSLLSFLQCSSLGLRTLSDSAAAEIFCMQGLMGKIKILTL